MANPPFELRYGDIELGGATAGSSGYSLTGRYSIRGDPRSVSVSAEVLVEASSSATFRTRCDDLEQQFELPRQTTVVLLNGTAMRSLSPVLAQNTGYDAAPSWRKPGSPLDSARSRVYEVAVTVGTPADLAGQDGRDYGATISVLSTPSNVRTVRFAGVYTAVPGVDAEENYELRAEAYAEAWLTAHYAGVTFELQTPLNTVVNDSDKEIRFDLVYEELIHNQTAALLDDPTIRGHRLLVTQKLEVGENAPLAGAGPIGGSVGRPLQVYESSWSCSIDRSEVANIPAKWESEIRDWMMTETRRLTGASELFILLSSAEFDPRNSTLNARLVVGVAKYGSLLATLVEVVQATKHGILFMPVADGDPDSNYEMRGKRSIIKSVTIVRLTIGDETLVGPQAAGSFASIPAPDGEGRFVLIDDEAKAAPIEQGVPNINGSTLFTVRIEERYIYKYSRAVEGGEGTDQDGGQDPRHSVDPNEDPDGGAEARRSAKQQRERLDEIERQVIANDYHNQPGYGGPP